MIRRPPRSTLLSLHDALPIYGYGCAGLNNVAYGLILQELDRDETAETRVAPFQLLQDERSEEHTSELQSRSDLVCRLLLEKKKTWLEPLWRSVRLYARCDHAH